MVAQAAPMVCSECGARHAPQRMFKVPGRGYLCEPCHGADMDAECDIEASVDTDRVLYEVAASSPPATVAPASASRPGRSPKAELRAWVRARVLGRPAVDLVALIAEGAASFAADGDFVARLAAELLPELLRHEAKIALRENHPVRLGQEAVTRDELATRAESLGRKVGSAWDTWMEQSGNRRMVLMAMTRGDLLAAAAWRESVSREHLGYARLWRTLAERLADGQRVRDRFRAAENERLYDGIRGVQKGA